LRLLWDTCVWGGAIGPLADAGHDVVWAGEWAEDPGDAEVLDLAHAEGRILVTLDKDFANWQSFINSLTPESCVW
jgi:predicted nuclease of predicted toxin-antitoxin system